jgi:hypothetical protein
MHNDIMAVCILGDEFSIFYSFSTLWIIDGLMVVGQGFVTLMMLESSSPLWK